jgi:hypothetical protein
MTDTVAITCCHEICGLTFYVPRGWHDQRLSNGKSFYCPNGHSQHFTGEIDKLKDEIVRLKSQVESRDRTIASVRDSRDSMTAAGR